MSVSTSSRSPSVAFGSVYDSSRGSPCSSSMPTHYSLGNVTPEPSGNSLQPSTAATTAHSPKAVFGEWELYNENVNELFGYGAQYRLDVNNHTTPAHAGSSPWQPYVSAGLRASQQDAVASTSMSRLDNTDWYNQIPPTMPDTVSPRLLEMIPGDSSLSETGESNEPSTPGSAEAQRTQRRQGVTCDHCRGKHIRCVPVQETADDSHTKRCQRCTEKDLACTRTYRPPSRRYPRPSRTGKRIEQARSLHGSVNGAGSYAASVATGPHAIFEQLLQPSVPHQANTRLHNDILAGSTSLRLLTCFFATAHMQMPIVDFHNFSARYNFAHGDLRIMSLMAQGGDAAQGIPAARQSAPGLVATSLPLGLSPTSSASHSTLSSPGTTEALVAAMHAWAALYTDMPIAFGADAASLSSQADSASEHSMEPVSQEDVDAKVLTAAGKVRRPKRKQGVACDTCRLRRLRCDKLERPEGMGCTRCEDKRIVCTDEYIQTKRRKVREQESRCKSEDSGDIIESASVHSFSTHSQGTLEDEGVIGSCSRHARDVARGSGPASWRASEEQTKWIDSGPTLPNDLVFGQSRRMLAYGIARQPFFRQLLQRAVALVHEHKLLEQPSIEAIQVMSILIQILHMITPSGTHESRDSEAYHMAEACNRHAKVLGLQSSDEVDEQDRLAVEQILSAMQRKRLWCCVWTRDALTTGLFRRRPAFSAERALGIRGGKARVDLETAQVSEQQIGTVLQAAKSSMSHSATPELNGEMGLSFSILAVMQVGALSRFAGKHLDNIQPPSELEAYASDPAATTLPPPAVRFPLLPTSGDIRKLTRACHALWSSIDALLLFFDKCALAAQHQMDTLHPFQPLGWIATIKVAAAMLDLCAFRILTERLQLAQTYLLALGASSSVIGPNGETTAPQAPAQEDYLRLAELQKLQQASQKRTFIGCRRIVKLVEHLLSKQVFQTGGLMLRHIVLIAQYLARSPCEISGQTLASKLQYTNDSSSHVQHQSNGSCSIDPRKLSSDTTDPDTVQKIDRRSSRGVPDALSSTNDLAPFDEQRKQYEVDVCLEAVAQLGYAWPGMDAEISNVEDMLRGSSSASGGSTASSMSL